MSCQPRYKREIVHEGGVVPRERERFPEFFSYWKAGKAGEVFFLEEVRICVDIEETLIDGSLESCPTFV